MNDYMVYLHTFKNDKIYIGKGKESRTTDFRNRSEYWKRVFCKHGEPKIDILDNELDEETALELEEFCIQEALDSGYALGGTMINFTMGGEGTSGHRHTEATKQVIGEASKACWRNKEYRENSVAKFRIWCQSDKGKKTKSRTTKEMWKNPKFKEYKREQIKKMWADETHREKISDQMKGINNPSARRANIYEYPSGKLIAPNVVSAEWARDNGYSRPKLQTTAKTDYSKPSTAKNPHHHKNVYMEYVDGK